MACMNPMMCNFSSNREETASNAEVVSFFVHHALVTSVAGRPDALPWQLGLAWQPFCKSLGFHVTEGLKAA